MAVKEELAGIVGAEYVSDDPETLEKYAKDYSFVQPRMPSYIVCPKNTEEIQGVVKYANERLIPITPRSSGVSFYGAGIPSQGGIILDLARMNKILEIDGRNKKVKVEPGVTWADMVYSRAATYTAVMKVVKNAFDPNNILNPGKLCF